MLDGISSEGGDKFAAPKPARSRKPQGSSVTPHYGRRKLKYYPVTDAELRDQGLSTTASSVLFSVASGCGVFALDLAKDFAITTGVPKEAAITWGGFKIAAIVIGFVSFVAGCYLTWRRHQFVGDLKAETDFE